MNAIPGRAILTPTAQILWDLTCANAELDTQAMEKGVLISMNALYHRPVMIMRPVTTMLDLICVPANLASLAMEKPVTISMNATTIRAIQMLYAATLWVPIAVFAMLGTQVMEYHARILMNAKDRPAT